MRKTSYLLVAVLGATASAGDNKAPAPAAGNPADITARLEAITSKSTHTQSAIPKFAFSGNLSIEHPANLDEATMGFPDTSVVDPKMTVVVFPDADTAIVAAHLGEHSDCGKAACAKQAPDMWSRASAVFERTNNVWEPLAWAVTASIPGTSQLDAMDEGTMPQKLGRDTAGADDVAKLFESTVGDPKAFIATFSDRKEVVMFGSELPERYAGPKAKAMITQWNFSFGIRDGLRAGMSKSGNVAWVAANVDGKSIKHPKNNPVPYRMFTIYEKTAAGWKVVQIQFSTSV